KMENAAAFIHIVEYLEIGLRIVRQISFHLSVQGIAFKTVLLQNDSVEIGRPLHGCAKFQKFGFEKGANSFGPLRMVFAIGSVFRFYSRQNFNRDASILNDKTSLWIYLAVAVDQDRKDVQFEFI